MKRHRTPWPSAPLLLLAEWLLLCSQALPAGAGEPVVGQGIGRLIVDLGSKDFEVRDAATRALMELEEAPPALRQALGSPDLEVRRRAAEAIEGIEQRRALRGLARAQALAKEGRIVEAVDRIVAFAGRDGEGMGGQALTQFTGTLLGQIPGALREMDLETGRGLMDVETRRGFPAGHYSDYVKGIPVRPKEIFGGKVHVRERVVRVFARGEEVVLDTDSCLFSLVAASGDVRCHASTPFSVIIAGGNAVVTPVQSTIIICDGDVEVKEPAGGCLIVARGKVTPANSLRGSLVRSEDYIMNWNGKRTFLKNGAPDPLRFVKFFELSDVGLEVADRDGQGEPVRDGICIKDVRKGTAFSLVLQANDVITAVDGTKAVSQEIFRKLLRKQLARGSLRITFTVRRAGRTLDVAAPVKE